MRRREAGLTLLEIMIACAVLVVMMSLAWRTIANTSESRKRFEKYEARNHELRMAMSRIVADFEHAYLSKNEDQNATYPRTMLIAKSSGKFPDVRFSTLAHRVLWADANESEQTVVSYVTKANPDNSSQTDWIRREQRRPSNEPPDDLPAEYDVIVHDIASAKIEFWNWKNLGWQDTWDTTQTDGQKGMLPSRVRITIVTKDEKDNEQKVTSQARILMQEPLLFQ
jgi:type II secretory pathway component PulJ